MSNILQKITSPESIVWVNIFFEDHCRRMSDDKLLEYIRKYIRSESVSMTATSDPLEDFSEYPCLSILIDATDVRLERNVSIESIAYEKIEQWVRDFPTAGLPFSRLLRVGSSLCLAD